jgi:2-polyprenyl-6-methoxyphenol hydroxylase-like FAD-dependent oxidoreductase
VTAGTQQISQAQSDQATCCIVGGGPAGVVLGFLLARAGVDVLVIEKHEDFFRDFRGDTIHPSTLEVMHELGVLDELLRLPHQRMTEGVAHFGRRVVRMADFTRLRTRCGFIALMPQWDFLDFLAGQARQFPGFRMRMGTEATGLIFDGERVVGVAARTAEGPLEVRAKLVVGADGRRSTVRTCAGLEVIDSGSPIDVLWFRLTRRRDDPPDAGGTYYISAGQFMVLINRDAYWQCAYVIRKGSLPQRQRQGIEAFRQDVARCVPFLTDRTTEIGDWDDLKLLSVRVDHLRTWHRDGLLCIGDAAHAMSPIAGVGINLAIQDAVAAANLLAPELKKPSLRPAALAAVQKRREAPARMTQWFQILLHKHLLGRIFDSPGLIRPPLFMRLADWFPKLQRLAARTIAVGFRPEHVESVADPGPAFMPRASG